MKGKTYINLKDMSASEKKKHRAKQFRECQKKRRALLTARWYELPGVNFGCCPRCSSILREIGWERNKISKGWDESHCLFVAALTFHAPTLGHSGDIASTNIIATRLHAQNATARDARWQASALPRCTATSARTIGYNCKHNSGMQRTNMHKLLKRQELHQRRLTYDVMLCLHVNITR